MRTKTAPVWAVILTAATSIAFGLLAGCEGPAVPAHGTDQGCWTCHGDRYEGTTEPAHAALAFPHECERCHVTADWEHTSIDVHPSDGPFPLLGQHQGKACTVCHTADGNYGGLSAECWSCHATDYAGAANPNHETLGYPHTCRDCHGFDGWRPARGAVHEVGGVFPLAGGHGGLACTRCHQVDDFTAVQRTCWGCHEANYRGTVSPNHVVENFPHTCGDCHSIEGWKPALPPQHGQGGSFPLADGHDGVACDRCHDVSDFGAVSPDCVACHRADYDGTRDPNHAQEQFPLTCQNCHTPKGWRPAMAAQHLAGGSFPLTGAHAAATCSDCHDTQDFANVSPQCVSCHRADYDGTRNPNHAQEQFPLACQSCHTTTAWKPAMASQHLAGGSFPLTGGHAAATCSDCHDTQNFANVSPQCASCHRADYDGTRNPNHAQQQFPLTCQNCHTTTAWKPATASPHLAGGSFPLTGGHAAASCSDCHDPQDFSAVSRQCVSCHRPDYDATTNPNHRTLSLATTCDTCHTTAGWRPAQFPNHRFPIRSGRHSGFQCNQCHTTSSWTAFSCIDCHTHSRAQTDSHHVGEVSGYSYTSAACYRCHPQGAERGD